MTRSPCAYYPVVVVGGGPTGLTVANLLGAYGMDTLLVERNETTVQEPRAVSIDDESLRTMQAIGAVDAVIEGVVAGYGSEYLTPSRKPFLKVEPTTAPYGFPRRNAFRQPILEAQIRKHLEEFPSVHSMFGWSMDALTQSETDITLTLVDARGFRQTVRCAYLVAADGASSPTRGHLGLLLEGHTFSERWVIVDLDNSPAPSRETVVFCDVRRPCIALPGPNDTRRFEFRLVATDDPDRVLDDENIRALLSSHGAAPQSQIVRKTIYTFHARLASQWSSGRVFLAGDACHLTPPFAGQGMNSGVRDAHNLSWKLAWVLRGVFPQTILETYQLERRDHVAEMIKLALRMGRVMAPRTRSIGWLTQSGFRLLSLYKPARDYFAQMRYKPPPRFRRGLILPDGRPWSKTAVGRLIPQPFVVTHDGRRRFDDLLGNGFAFLGFTATLREFLDALEVVDFTNLAARRIYVSTDSTAARGGPGICVILDKGGDVARGLDAARGRIFLVRPDRYVLGIFKPELASDFANRLQLLLSTHLEPVTVNRSGPTTTHADPASCTLQAGRRLQ
jgi:3-(3-hydroxy-phenyl)propionate hydroxylase